MGKGKAIGVDGSRWRMVLERRTRMGNWCKESQKWVWWKIGNWFSRKIRREKMKGRRENKTKITELMFVVESCSRRIFVRRWYLSYREKREERLWLRKKIWHERLWIVAWLSVEEWIKKTSTYRVTVAWILKIRLVTMKRSVISVHGKLCHDTACLTTITLRLQRMLAPAKIFRLLASRQRRLSESRSAKLVRTCGRKVRAEERREKENRFFGFLGIEREEKSKIEENSSSY